MKTNIILLGIFILILAGCSENQPVQTRFITYKIYDESNTKPEVSFIEFTDGRAIQIECIRVATDGQTETLWTERLQPYYDGLGNTVIAKMSSNIMLKGGGREHFSHDIKIKDGQEIFCVTGGRNASLDPSNIAWFCIFKNEDSKPIKSLTSCVENVDMLIDWALKYNVELIAIRASIPNDEQ